MHKEPLGDGRFQITYCTRAEHGDNLEPEDPNVALLTVRGKDHDVTPEQLDAIAQACHDVAAFMRADTGKD